jgi:fluoride exporter
MSAWIWIAVAALGGIGATGRFLLDALIGGRGASALPLGTFAINTSGAFSLGLLTGLAVGGELLLLLGTAALGSFTTFSTWLFEAQRSGEDGGIRPAVVVVLAGLAAGVGAAALGRVIGVAL